MRRGKGEDRGRGREGEENNEAKVERSKVERLREEQ